jgi:hypothetical protein
MDEIGDVSAPDTSSEEEIEHWESRRTWMFNVYRKRLLTLAAKDTVKCDGCGRPATIRKRSLNVQAVRNAMLLFQVFRHTPFHYQREGVAIWKDHYRDIGAPSPDFYRLEHWGFIEPATSNEVAPEDWVEGRVKETSGYFRLTEDFVSFLRGAPVDDFGYFFNGRSKDRASTTLEHQPVPKVTISDVLGRTLDFEAYDYAAGGSPGDDGDVRLLVKHFLSLPAKKPRKRRGGSNGDD